MLRVTDRTWRNWESGRIQAPYAAFKLLRILTGYALPSDAWAGWIFSGDAPRYGRLKEKASQRPI